VTPLDNDRRSAPPLQPGGCRCRDRDPRSHPDRVRRVSAVSYAAADRFLSVSPVRLFEGTTKRLEIDGANLRPFLRVSLNSTPAKSFLIGSTKYALVDLPDLKPGEYDVVLFDAVREVARLPKALTVAPMVSDVEAGSRRRIQAGVRLIVGAAKSRRQSSRRPEKRSRRSLPPGAPTAGDLRLRVGADTISVPLRQLVWPATLRVKCYTAHKPDGGPCQCIVPTGSGNDDSNGCRPRHAADAVIPVRTARFSNCLGARGIFSCAGGSIT